MNPIDMHFRVIMLLRDVPTHRRVPVIARGVAFHDGERIELRSDDDDSCLCMLPDDLVEHAMPVTGAFCRWYPGADYYIVCGDRDLPGLGGRSN